MHVENEYVEVYVSPTGDVCLAQRTMNEDCLVAIPPEGIDALIRDLRAEQAQAMALRQRLASAVPTLA